jgi:hypothetical protein
VILNGEKYVGKPRNRCFAVPVTLQFADELHPTGELATGLLQAPQTGFVRLH